MQKSIDDMTFDELDALREQLRLPQTVICQRGDLNPTTYTRWRRWARGEPGGSEPNRRSVKALRDALRVEATRHMPAADGRHL